MGKICEAVSKLHTAIIENGFAKSYLGVAQEERLSPDISVSFEEAEQKTRAVKEEARKELKLLLEKARLVTKDHIYANQEESIKILSDVIAHGERYLT
jgi:vacuolar-type H+-ATPase subunit H